MRYAILSDIHANLPALEAVLDDLAVQSIDATLYLGDAVGYYADSVAVVERLHEIISVRPCLINGQASDTLLWVAGNHEWGLLGRMADTMFSGAALVAIERTRANLPAATVALLEALPQRIELDLGDGLAATLVHASPSDPIDTTGASYIENGEDARMAARSFATPICLVGHTHYPRVCYESEMLISGDPVWDAIDVFEDMLPGGRYDVGAGQLILNPGSVGQPRDGDPRAAYAILDTAARTFTVRRVTYDIAATQSRVRAWLDGAANGLLDGRGGLAGRLVWGN